ncbi:hypothetical protein DFS34DRAFT_369807 [Phlyctochytrium arcticum]|nr:hypothetical protein DFS34DRAFT_369807 [Phlyctochytrium arcticum]
MSFFQSLVKVFGLKGGSGASACHSIFPSANFLESVRRSNELWITHCLQKPLRDARNKTQIHLLGTSLLNVPPARHVRQVLPHLKKDIGWICVDEADEATGWLNSYAECIKQCPLGTEPASETFNDLETYLSGMRTWSTRIRGELVDDGVPEVWTDVLEATGLRPGWDTVEAVELGQERHIPVECIGIGAAEESQRVAIHMSTMSQAPHTTQSDSVIEPVDKALRELFRSIDVASEDVGRIDTGSELADSRIQNLVLDPEQIAQYQRIVSRHIQHHASTYSAMDYRRRLADVRKQIQCERIVERLRDVSEELGATGDGDAIILAVVDRNNIEAVRRIWEDECISTS